MTDLHTLSPASKPKTDPPAPDKPVYVDVYAKTVGGITEWSHEWRWGENGPSEGNGTIDIPERKPDEPGTRMHFYLRDQTDPKCGYQYDDNQGAAMWVKRDSCPPHDERSDDPQIPPDQMETAPKLLKAFNVNSDKCNLHYRLWFKDKNGNPDSYDPDITNGGKSLA
jgi:hypothetical protein